MSINTSSYPLKTQDDFIKQRTEVDGLTRRRFFYRPASEIYGGSAGFFSYGPPGCAVKNHMFATWRQHFVVEENLMEIEDTCIMQEKVLKASGHVDKFTDFIVKDSGDQSRFWRADKLLEEVMEAKIEKTTDEGLKKEYQIVLNSADGYTAKELVEVFDKYEITAPIDPKTVKKGQKIEEMKGNKLTEPVAFNLMFPTPIGPIGHEKGFLRPETAQGIFLNYKFCLEQNSNKIPFGIAQIGKVFRNEIAPRAGLTRQREFQQMEIEYFIKPGNYKHEKWNEIEDVEVMLFSAKAQMEAEQPKKVSLKEAVKGKEGIIKDDNEIMGYMIGRTYQFLVKMGCNPNCLRFRQHITIQIQKTIPGLRFRQHMLLNTIQIKTIPGLRFRQHMTLQIKTTPGLRFRQHMPKEMAHYAADCWDAEALTSYGWLEIVGIANRAAFDLSAHAKAAKVDLQVRENLPEPIEQEVCTLTKTSKNGIQKALKSKPLIEALEELSVEEMDKLQAIADDKSDGKDSFDFTVKCLNQTFSINKEMFKTEKKKTKVSSIAYTPSVIEPSFGVDRILFTIFEHTYTRRPGQEDIIQKMADEKSAENIRSFLSLPWSIAPYTYTILPVDGRITRDDRYKTIVKELKTGFTMRNLAGQVDDSGAGIGKRYSRNDEVGIPFAITIDTEALEGKGVTIRERNSCGQIRVPLNEAVEVITSLFQNAGKMKFEDIACKYESVANAAVEAVGVLN